MTDALALRRDPAQAQIAGVCAGLARRWGWTARSVRILFVVVAILTMGYSVGVYLALWALVPRQGQSVEPIRAFLPFTRSWSRAALILVVVATLFLVLGISNVGPGALVIMGIVWWVMRRSRRATQPARVPPPPPPPSTEFERMSLVWQQRLANVEAGLPPDWEARPAAPLPPTTVPSARTDPERTAAGRRRGHRTWLWVLVALGVVYFGIHVVGGFAGDPSGLVWASSTLAVLGVALVLVSRPSRAAYGRPRGLVLATSLTALATLFGIASTQVSAYLPTETRVIAVTSSTPSGDDLGIGSTVVDLSAVQVTEDWSVAYTMDMGQLTIDVPDEGNVRVVSAVDVGGVATPDDSDGGLEVSVGWERITDDGPVLTITTQLDLGATEVTA